ncbi:MAG: 1-acyl-sn-glycerol-3-phosphate acyltransferase [Gammaproteobacteria bacterium]|nr:1-acyl-sn-glycerol-3-phosphate acyltransferase [Gammaproteobacteria bacterium]
MKKKRWSRFRHRVTIQILRIILLPYLRLKYHFKFEKLHDKRQYLLLFNHQSFSDQFFAPAALRNNKFYIVMSDDLDSIPVASSLMRFLVHPIPFKKAGSDLIAIKNMIKIRDEGASIVLSPEGNRTYVGKTEYINPTIAKLAKLLKLPILFINIHGFYSNPRFALKPRKAKAYAEVRNIVEYEDYKSLSNEELYELIKENLDVNDYNSPQLVKSKDRAEALERVLFVCPKCGITHFRSNKDTVKCESCGDTYHLNEDYTFKEGNFKTIIDWDNYQRYYVLEKKMSDYKDDYVITSDKINFYKVIPHKKKQLLFKDATISLFKDRLEISGPDKKDIIYLKDINSTGCFGPNKVNLLMDDGSLQIKGDERFNPLKYVYHIFKYKIEEGKITNNYLGI